MPHLRDLSLRNFSMTGMQDVLAAVRSCQSVRTLRMVAHGVEPGYTIGAAQLWEVFAALRQLTSFEFGAWVGYDMLADFPLSQPTFEPTIRHLALIGCLVTTDALASLNKACDGLVTLRLQHLDTGSEAAVVKLIQSNAFTLRGLALQYIEPDAEILDRVINKLDRLEVLVAQAHLGSKKTWAAPHHTIKAIYLTDLGHAHLVTVTSAIWRRWPSLEHFGATTNDDTDDCDQEFRACPSAQEQFG